MTDFETITTDVLVVGSGGAALRAILAASDGGADVTVVVKNEFRKSGATFYSVAEVGAYNVPDGAGDPSDSPEVFARDILTAAQGMADPRLVDILVTEAERSLQYLEDKGVHFEREGSDYLAFRACFSSKPRSHVLKDHFKPIIKALGQEASRRGIKVRDRMMVVGLLERDGTCHGALAMDRDGNPVVIRAKSVILTTGGASQLFAKNLYPSDITGDGYAMAYRAGAQLANMEFMQAGVSIIDPFINLFGNYLWDASPNLTDRDGRPFMPDYLPSDLTSAEVIQEKERHFPFSSSDISRYIEISIQSAINDGRGTEKGGVYLDFKGCDFDRLLADKSRSFARMWPLTHAWYKEKGIDLYTDPVQITCSAHAINGGLRIDGNAESSLKGLFASGETAAGPHGADRLGGNMAMTCQVFGARGGAAAAARAKAMPHEDLGNMAEAHLAFLASFARQGGDTGPGLRAELQDAANRHLLILRNEVGLTQFLSDLDALQHRLKTNAAADTAEAFVHLIETDNLIETARMMARAALARRESRGSHYREDAPASVPDFDQSQIIERTHSHGGFFAKLETL
ncbi:FAD-binding protein [Marinovum sp. 2_MG-2023]|uniref:FAD-binding protein n=1 Tax=unclassified Marinovum TaxID=2647166 RepID=UPI0026E11C49|nr:MULTISPECIES: FAD-binding protein [unclassified Marinovum]MDO6732593.1 FAD-binding protein [Marinovum sp. 2_MG-2023]MDO6782090.1 FAD-binding protein [Marinovum sp. 1_MG-2023]